MDLDAIYKTMIADSHEAGLEAVYRAGFNDGVKSLDLTPEPVKPEVTESVTESTETTVS